MNGLVQETENPTPNFDQKNTWLLKSVIKEEWLITMAKNH